MLKNGAQILNSVLQFFYSLTVNFLTIFIHQYLYKTLERISIFNAIFAIVYCRLILMQHFRDNISDFEKDYILSRVEASKSLVVIQETDITRKKNYHKKLKIQNISYE